MDDIDNARDEARRAYLELVSEERDIARALRPIALNRVDDENLVGCAVGHKSINGAFVDELAAVFFVKTKIGAAALGSKALPATIDVEGRAVRTDVVVLDEPTPFGFPPLHLPPFPPPILPLIFFIGNPAANNLKYRPVEMGTSIGVFVPKTQTLLNWGTSGALVQSRLGASEHYILSDRHVLTKHGELHDDVTEPRPPFGMNRVPCRIRLRLRCSCTSTSGRLPASLGPMTPASSRSSLRSPTSLPSGHPVRRWFRSCR